MSLRSRVWCTALLVSVVVLGCHKEEPPTPDLPQVARGKGTITGIVKFVGTAPAGNSAMVVCDPSTGAKMLHTDRTVAVSKSGGLADVYVFVKRGTAGAIEGSGKGEPAKVLDQVGCAFVPHALGVQIGQSLRIKNSDPTFHNVHWEGKLNDTQNLGFRPAGTSAEKVVAFAKPEFLSVRCDVHQWMTSTIGVFAHPFFATTDEEGRFTIEGLPPGTYTLTTWHPLYAYGTEQEITVSENASATADFAYRP